MRTQPSSSAWLANVRPGAYRSHSRACVRCTHEKGEAAGRSVRRATKGARSLVLLQGAPRPLEVTPAVASYAAAPLAASASRAPPAEDDDFDPRAATSAGGDDDFDPRGSGERRNASNHLIIVSVSAVMPLNHLILVS
jgi:hypothetical protein